MDREELTPQEGRELAEAHRWQCADRELLDRRLEWARAEWGRQHNVRFARDARVQSRLIDNRISNFDDESGYSWYTHAEAWTRAGKVVAATSHPYHPEPDVSDSTLHDLTELFGLVVKCHSADSGASWYFPGKSSLIEIWRPEALGLPPAPKAVDFIRWLRSHRTEREAISSDHVWWRALQAAPRYMTGTTIIAARRFVAQYGGDPKFFPAMLTAFDAAVARWQAARTAAPAGPQ